MEPRWYIYRMICDNGGAPCVQNGMLSLGICKPVIRRGADIGDWLIGVGGVALGRRLIYMAEITEVLEDGAYFRDPRFLGRRDRIYQFNDAGELVWRPDAQYHLDGVELLHDVGSPGPGGVYPKARVVLSTNFRYLGGDGNPAMLEEFEELNRVLSHLTRGHRVNHSVRVMHDITALHHHLWDNPDYLQSGRPSEPPERAPCMGAAKD